MKAVGYTETGPIDRPEALIDFDAPLPELGPHDLLVEVRGVSVNPVDTKVRTLMAPQNGPRILGFDACGVVREVGSEVRLFHAGDEVFYAGDLTRAGSNAELQAVDERIVGIKPQSLGFAEAAGLPLTSITAWEILFDAFAFDEGDGQGDSLLILGGAGGVGSILIQLAKKLTDLTVITTASRPETIDWVHKMGADHVINHRESLVDQLRELGIAPRYVASLTGTEGHFPAILEAIQPRGHMVVIDDPPTLDIKAGKQKALTFSWEFMFTRSMFHTEDIEKQHQLLSRIAAMLDDGQLLSTVTTHLGPMSAATLIEAHRHQESGTAIGKTVLDGF